MSDRQKLKENLPHGFCKVVAAKAGVTNKSVSNYLSGKTNSWTIEKCILEVIAELDSERLKITKPVTNE